MLKEEEANSSIELDDGAVPTEGTTERRLVAVMSEPCGVPILTTGWIGA